MRKRRIMHLHEHVREYVHEHLRQHVHEHVREHEHRNVHQRGVLLHTSTQPWPPAACTLLPIRTAGSSHAEDQSLLLTTAHLCIHSMDRFGACNLLLSQQGLRQRGQVVFEEGGHDLRGGAHREQNSVVACAG